MKKIEIDNKMKIQGVRVTDVNVETLIKKLDELGLSYESNEPADLLGTFQDWSKKNMKELQDGKKPGEEIDYGQCTKCKVHMPQDWEQCPVCGTKYDENGNEKDENEEKSHKAQLVKAQDLDDAVVRIKRHKDEVEHGIYNLGLELRAVFDNQLYKARLDSDNKSKYPSFEAFVEEEVGLSAPRCRTYMLISKEFTEKQVVDIGPEKLRSIARLDRGEDREKMLEKAKEMSTREISKAVANSQKIKGPDAIANSFGEKEQKKLNQLKGLSNGTEAAKEARERKKAVKDGKAVTAVFQDTDYELPMTEMANGEGYECYETLVNGTVRYYRAYINEDNLRMRITTARNLEDARVIEESNEAEEAAE